MNGFTSSLHVKGVTAKRLQQAVTDLLHTEGFRVLLADDDNGNGDEQPITRGVWVAKSKGDWASVFCSDFMFQQEIGRELSRQLQTHTLNVWVTEGSAWHYSLFENGEEIDQFDSTGGDDDLYDSLDEGLAELTDEGDDVAEDEDELSAVVEDDEDASPIQEGLSRLAELQENFAGRMPDDVKEIYDRLSEGKASLGDMRRFDQWSQANQADLAQFQDQLQQQTAELTATMQGFFQQGFGGETNDADAARMLQGALPPDVAQMFSRMMSGQMTPEEMQQFAEDMGGEVPEQEDDLQGLTDVETGEVASGGAEFDDEDDDDDDDDFEDDDLEEDEPSGITEEQLQMHLGALQPLLGKSVDPDELADALTSADAAPEEPLGDFLNLLGIEGSLAHFDFDLLEQTTDEDLADAGIKLSPLLLVRSA